MELFVHSSRVRRARLTLGAALLAAAWTTDQAGDVTGA